MVNGLHIGQAPFDLGAGTGKCTWPGEKFSSRRSRVGAWHLEEL